LVIGLGGIIVAGIAVFAALSISSEDEPGSLRVTTVRPIETIGSARSSTPAKTEAVKPNPEPVQTAPPLGTTKRMEGISKAFTKQ
jgi:hypothetical protein